MMSRGASTAGHMMPPPLGAETTTRLASEIPKRLSEVNCRGPFYCSLASGLWFGGNRNAIRHPTSSAQTSAPIAEKWPSLYCSIKSNHPDGLWPFFSLTTEHYLLPTAS